jgi:hypothetical protein
MPLAAAALVASLTLPVSAVPKSEAHVCQPVAADRVVVSKPALIFVWPDYLAADDFTKEGLRRDAERAEQDQHYSEQFYRLSERTLALGLRSMKCASRKARFDFVQPHGVTDRLDLSKEADWRGTVSFCPGHHPVVTRGLTPDETLLRQLSNCTK